MTRTTLVTIAVTGPYHRGDYHWQVDGPGGITSGFGATFAEARTAAGEAAVTCAGAPRGAPWWRRPVGRGAGTDAMSDSTLGAWRFVLADGQEIIFSNVTGVDLGQNEEGDRGTSRRPSTRDRGLAGCGALRRRSHRTRR